jgi:hypothetical protein
LTDRSFTIGIVGDAGVRGVAQQPRLFMGMILILIFGEALGELRQYSNLDEDWTDITVGLYGMIIALMMVTQSTIGVGVCP